MCNAGKPGNGFVIDGVVQFDCLKIRFVIYIADADAEGLGVGDNVAYGKEFGDVVTRFIGHTQVFVGRFETLRPCAVDGASDITFPPVVGGKCKRPVAE